MNWRVGMSLRIRVQRNEFYYQVGFGRVETAAAAAAAAGVFAVLPLVLFGVLRFLL